jgi:hypothetical protein
MKLTALVLLTSAVFVATLVAQSPMRPGRWETTVQMEMPDLPVSLPATKDSQCITAADLEKDPASGLPRAMQGRGRGRGDACTYSDYKVSGNMVTWKMACAGDATMNGTGELTFVDDSFTGTMKMAMEQGAMTIKMTGKRVGDCTQ